MKLNKSDLKIQKSLLIIFLFLIVFSSSVFSDLGLGFSPSSKEWVNFTKNIICTISSDVKYSQPESGKFPIFTIKLRYNGNHKYMLKWDKNFGHVLWNGKFLLLSKKDQKQLTTKNMKYQTSNTYDARQNILLKKGKELKAYLNFNSLPGRFAKNLFKKRGLLKFHIAVVVNKKIKTISNEILIRNK